MRFPILFVLFITCQHLFCQTEEAPPIKFGKVPTEDLTMTVFEPDSTAEAVVLCDYETVMVSITNEVLVRKGRHRRIKILDKKGFGYGDVEIPFYSYKKRERFFFDKATIHFPDGSFEKLDKKDIFVEEINEYWSRAKFAFPKVQEGCVIEYAYFINSSYYYEPEDWFFQEEIPVRHSELRINFPSMLDYTYFFQGNERMNILKNEPELQVLQGLNGTCTIKPGVYIFENAPAMKPESYLTTMNDYRARIRFQLSEVRHSDGRIEKVTDTWENLQKELRTSEMFGHHYLKKGYYNDITNQLSARFATMDTQKEKASLAYGFITKNVSWNGRYAIFAGVDKIKNQFEKGSGNSAQINLMLLVLLREAGIEAGPVLTSTRSHGRMFEAYPLLDQFNHLLIQAEIDGKPILMDATDPLRPMGYPDVEALNGRGWHVEKGWVDIQPPSVGIDGFVTNLSLSENGNISGEMIGMYKGYNATPERERHLEDPSGKHWEKRFAKKFSDAKVESVSSNEVLAIDQNFTDTIHFSIENAAQVAGDFIYFSPVIYTGFSESPFKLKERNYPVDFPYGIREQHNIKVSLPAGYVVEEIPQNIRVSLPNKGGSFIYATNDTKEGQLSFNIMFSIKQLKYFPEEYSAIKSFFDQFVDKLKEQVVLKKTG